MNPEDSRQDFSKLFDICRIGTGGSKVKTLSFVSSLDLDRNAADWEFTFLNGGHLMRFNQTTKSHRIVCRPKDDYFEVL